MTNEECYKLLRQYNLWRRGKGKKYSHPGFPFDSTTIGEAIDQAVECVKAICKTQKVFDAEEPNEPAR